MIEVRVAEIRVSGVETAPVVVLVEVGPPSRRLPIWMSHGGAAAIFSATDEPDEDRPSIHDVAGQLALALPEPLIEARITACDEGEFYAELVFANRSVATRASDAIAIALRVGCRVLCAPEVLDEYGVLPDLESEPSVGDDEVERFREFLNSVNPDDFSGGGDKL
jgi:bifunctional DNase/RNase